MLSPLLKAVILLTISGAAHARPQANHEIGVGVLDDWVSSGNYLIYSCGSQAGTVQSLLDFSYLYLQTAILSTSTPPYKAFFHSADPASVSTILTSMTLGINVTVSEHVSRRPTLVCVNERDEGLRSAWTLCRNHPKAVSAANPGVAMILLCPSFFELAAAPDVADCPMVNLAETRLVGSRGLMNKQYIFLVQELAKLYIPGTIGGEGTSVKDIPGENQCLGLPESQALRNPSSYAYYAGCECRLSFLHLFITLLDIPFQMGNC